MKLYRLTVTNKQYEEITDQLPGSTWIEVDATKENVNSFIMSKEHLDDFHDLITEICGYIFDIEEIIFTDIIHIDTEHTMRKHLGIEDKANARFYISKLNEIEDRCGVLVPDMFSELS